MGKAAEGNPPATPTTASLSPTQAGQRSDGRERETSGPVVLRFRRPERSLHWALAVPFLVCLVSAAVLVLYYNPLPMRPYRQAVSWIHRIAGIGLIVLPALALAGNRGDYQLHLQNIKQAWGWTLADLKWLALVGVSAVSKRVSLPEQGKFNAGEKLNFMMVMTTYPLLILTGVMIWLPGVAFLAWVVHFGLAVAVSPLVVGHTYMALINPSTRKGLPGMITGYVDRQWAKHHYQQWYRENFDDDLDAAGSATQETLAPEATPPERAELSCPSCGEQVHAPWAWLVQRIVGKDAISCPHCTAEIREFALTTDSVQLRSMLVHLERAHLEDPSKGTKAAYSLVDRPTGTDL